MENLITIPTRRQVYEMLVAGKKAEQILDTDYNFSSRKEATDFIKMVNEVAANIVK